MRRSIDGAVKEKKENKGTWGGSESVVREGMKEENAYSGSMLYRETGIKST